MPSAYTMKIQENCSFQEFLFACARQFGALMHLREDSTKELRLPTAEDFSIPYHEEEKKKAEEDLEDLVAMTQEERAEICEAEHRELIKSAQESIAKGAEIEKKYEAMLIKVQEWEPPTESHAHLKEYMVKQINDSIKFDGVSEFCIKRSLTEKPSTEEWFDELVKQTSKHIGYHAEKIALAKTSLKENIDWIEKLKASVS